MNLLTETFGWLNKVTECLAHCTSSTKRRFTYWEAGAVNILYSPQSSSVTHALNIKMDTLINTHTHTPLDK